MCRFKIIDDDTKEVLFEHDDLLKVEGMLCYFLNHDHDAYIVEELL